jgi:hypothetical protein
MKRKYRKRGAGPPASLPELDIEETVQSKADILLRKFDSLDSLLKGYGCKLSERQEEELELILELFYYVALCGVVHIHLDDIHLYNSMWDGLELPSRKYYGAEIDYRDKWKENYRFPRSLDDYQPDENGVWHPPMKKIGKPQRKKLDYEWRKKTEIEELDQLLKQYYQQNQQENGNTDETLEPPDRTET